MSWELRGGGGSGECDQVVQVARLDGIGRSGVRHKEGEVRELIMCDYDRAVGVLAGLAVSTFSRTLAVLFGLLVFGVQVSVPLFMGLDAPLRGCMRADWRWNVVRSLQGVLFTDRKDKAVRQRNRCTVYAKRQYGLQVELRVHISACGFRRALTVG